MLMLWHILIVLALYFLAYNVIGLSELDSVKYVKEKLIRDYSEIDEDVKNLVKKHMKK